MIVANVALDLLCGVNGDTARQIKDEVVGYLLGNGFDVTLECNECNGAGCAECEGLPSGIHIGVADIAMHVVGRVSADSVEVDRFDYRGFLVEIFAAHADEGPFFWSAGRTDNEDADRHLVGIATTEPFETLARATESAKAGIDEALDGSVLDD